MTLRFEGKRLSVRLRSRVLRLLAVPLLAGAMAAAMTVPSGASIQHPDVVSEDPVGYTPHLVDDDTGRQPRIHAYAQHGSTMYAGGIFSHVEDSQRTVTYSRQRLFSFDVSTGAVTGFAPSFNAAVWALQVVGDSLYVGGEFSEVDGVARRALVKFDLATGQIDPTFVAPFRTGRVTSMAMVRGQLIVGGTFPRRLMSLNATTGRATTFVQTSIQGQIPDSGGKIEVLRFAVNPLATRLVAIGNFLTVDGQERARAFMLNLEGATATLGRWHYLPLERKCRSKVPFLQAYLRDVDFSPDGKWFVVVASGYVPTTDAEIGTMVCDAVARFDVAVGSPTQPKWINYTGGDTLTSVAATGAAVYVQGHSRWLDNPYGRDTAGPGAVSRPGGGAVDPATGMALPWNPVKPSQVGGYELFATPVGLWIGTDGRRIFGEYHRGISFQPLP